MSENAPHNCPGVESEDAGKASACAGCPNQSLCASGPKGPDPAIAIIADRLKNIDHKILVLSGKGGVGKSTFASQLAWTLSASDDQIGLLDIDICGPSAPLMTGLTGSDVRQTSMGWTPVYAEDNLAVISIGFLLKNDNEAVIWRGPKKNTIIKQFLKDVFWGEKLNFLIVDCPPGTSDEHLSVTTLMGGGNGVDGAVIVTTPQEISLLDVRKEINFCRKANVPILGVVENMSGFACPKCHVQSNVFVPSTGGAEKMAKEMGVPFLGSLPLDPALLAACEEGRPYLPHPRDGEDELEEAKKNETVAQTAFRKVVDEIKLQLQRTKATPSS